MVYGSEAVLPTNLDYGAPRIIAYGEQGAEASHEDAIDQLDEAHDVALLRSAKYQQALRWYHGRRVQDRAFNIRGPCSPPCAEQQGPPQALPTLGGVVRHRGSTPARRLKVENHRR